MPTYETGLPPAATPAPREPDWTTRAEHDRQSSAGTHLFDEACPWCRAVPREDGTETSCPLEGVHEHVFRGPHRFREWEPVTYLENARRGISFNGTKTHCPKGHPYSSENTRIHKRKSRYCRACEAAWRESRRPAR